jgi:hypothetical protein
MTVGLQVPTLSDGWFCGNWDGRRVYSFVNLVDRHLGSIPSDNNFGIVGSLAPPFLTIASPSPHFQRLDPGGSDEPHPCFTFAGFASIFPISSLTRSTLMRLLESTINQYVVGDPPALPLS